LPSRAGLGLFCKRSDYLEIISESGIVIKIGDGIVKIYGLTGVTAGEMVLIGRNQVRGMVINLESKSVGVVVFGNDRAVKQGDIARRSYKIMNITLSMAMFGRVIDGLGTDLLENSSDYLSKASYTCTANIDTKAIGIIERKSVTEPMQTGIKLVDSLIPIGCGQRELIIGDRQTGKTTIAMDTIINQKLNGYLFCIYVAIGQKRSNVAHTVEKLKRLGCMQNTVVVASTADDPCSLQYLAPYAGCTIGE
jgi:proton translocating ATP synthase F1 alpha subunit